MLIRQAKTESQLSDDKIKLGSMAFMAFLMLYKII